VCTSGTKATRITLSWCANSERWQSPKSRPVRRRHEMIDAGPAPAQEQVRTPYLDVLVRRTADQQRRIGRHVQAEHGQTVAVEREMELERVLVEHLDGAIQQTHGDVLQQSGTVQQMPRMHTPRPRTFPLGVYFKHMTSSETLSDLRVAVS
jgi:hypothetical protein